MLLNAKTLAIAAIVVICLCWSTARAQRPCSGPVCHNKFDVGCAPKRDTYGYYQTTWRRWPTDKPTAASQRAEEVMTPTPAKDSRPQVESGDPQVVPEDTMTPTDNAPIVDEPTTPEPTPQSDMSLPFDERPNEAPKRSPRHTPAPGLPEDATEPAPSAETPDEPAEMQQTPLDTQDSPPAMPDDDPFKDDPPAPDKTPGADSRLNGSDQPLRLSNGPVVEQAALRWHGTSRSKVDATESAPLRLIPSGEEPGLLQPTPIATAESRAATPSSSSPKRNPLRSTTAKPRSTQVMPTAHWTAEPVSTNSSTGIRRNPLRAN